MYAKKGQVVIRGYNQKVERGGIELPQTTKEQSKYVVVAGSVARELGDVSIGDVVLIRDGYEVESATLWINGVSYLHCDLDRLEVVIDHDDEVKDVNGDSPIATIQECVSDVKALGKRVAVKRNITDLGFTKAGDIFVPMKHRELMRTGIGAIVSIGEEAASESGLFCGAYVWYDSWSSHGKRSETDVVDVINVISVLSEADLKRSLKIADEA